MRIEFAGPQTNPELNTAVGAFVSHSIFGASDKITLYSSMAVFENNVLVAGIVFHNWHPDCGTVEISGAAKTSRWLNGRILNAMFGFAFDQLNCQAVVARHAATNKRLRRMWRAVGSQEYLIPRLRGKDKPDECVTVLTDDAWRASSFARP